MQKEAEGDMLRLVARVGRCQERACTYEEEEGMNKKWLAMEWLAAGKVSVRIKAGILHSSGRQLVQGWATVAAVKRERNLHNRGPT